MKKNLIWGMMFLVAVVFTSCESGSYEKEFIGFEDFQLDSTGVYNGSDLKGVSDGSGNYVNNLSLGSAAFENVFTVSQWGGFWKGFAISAQKDTITAGYMNQYSCISGIGASNSAKYALAYDSAVISFMSGAMSVKPQSIMLNNTTYAYKDVKTGSMFSKKFTTGDWFKVIIRGVNGNVETGKVEYYLADFRNGKSFVLNKWTSVSLSSLGEVTSLIFTFDSSDKSGAYLNTPAYVCVDNLNLSVPVMTE